jgi:hypothetical protein
MGILKFKTKIFIHDDAGKFCDLILPNGNVVASGMHEYIWDIRDDWEEALERKDFIKAPKKCRECKNYIFSKTLGSPETNVWHCRDGFTPSADNFCKKLAASNAIDRKHYCHQTTLKFS